jgi:hypothetical protein
MLIFSNHFRMHRYWFAAFVAGTTVAIGWYLLSGVGASRWPGGSSPPGLALGVVGGGIILFECLLWPRKMLRSWRIGSARLWMKAHIWLGLLSAPLILLHSGFQWGGQLSTLLAVLFIIVIASGVFGLAMQQMLPKLLLDTVPSETIASQIDHVLEQLSADAEGLVLAICGPGAESLAEAPSRLSPSEAAHAAPILIGARRTVEREPGHLLQIPIARAPIPNPERLSRPFNGTIKPYLVHGSRASRQLADRGKAADYFRDLRSRLDPAALPVVDALEDCCEQRRQLDRQSRIHWWLHSWLCIHLPLSMALLMFMFVHIYMALKYW